MAGLNPHPPSVLHSSKRLTHKQAHTLLSTFLSQAENDAAYRPDSTLTERGPQSASTGANPNLTLHHLQRILMGMEGKRMVGGVIAAGEEGGEDVDLVVGGLFGEGAKLRPPTTAAALQRAKKRKLDGESENVKKRQSRTGDGAGDPEDGWQDKGDYDLAQQDDEVDMAAEDRHPGVHLEEPANSEEAEGMAEIEIESTGRKVGLSEQHASESTLDKKARKAAKKARQQEERRKKEDAKAKK